MITKFDLIGSAVLGLLTAIFFLILSYTTITEITQTVERPPLFYWASLILFPALAAIGMFLIADLARRLRGTFEVLYQFYKFALVGTVNTLIDLSVLNFLITLTGFAAGWQFSVFKGVSFAVAVINSYFWNRIWTFGRGRGAKIGEFSQFFLVTLGGLLINVGVASFLVNIVGPPYGITPRLWASIAALGSIAISMFWNFAGYKFIVFSSKVKVRNKNTNESNRIY